MSVWSVQLPKYIILLDHIQTAFVEFVELSSTLYWTDMWSTCIKNNIVLSIVVSDTWSKLQPIGHGPSSRTAHAAACVGKKIFVHGGMSSVGTVLDDVYSLDAGWQLSCHCTWLCISHSRFQTDRYLAILWMPFLRTNSCEIHCNLSKFYRETSPQDSFFSTSVKASTLLLSSSFLLLRQASTDLAREMSRVQNWMERCPTRVRGERD